MNYNRYTDKELIVLLREQSPVRDQAFYVLYNRYAEKLNSYCLFKADNTHDAEEIFQETWIKFFNTVQNGKIIESVTAFLYKIARNLSIDKYRNNKRMQSQSYDYFDFEQLADPLNLHDKLVKDELLTIISIALNNLDEKCREAFVLRWFSGLTNSEIAGITGENSGSVKMRNYRALNEVIKMLKPYIIEISE